MRWTDDELLLVLHLYERIPFGQQHQLNPQVVELAQRLGRTPGSVAMKLNNFTSLDPDEQARGVRGLVGASALDRRTWDAFRADAAVVERSEELWEARVEHAGAAQVDEVFTGPTESVGSRNIRLGQRYFRRAVLANFGNRCALTGLAAPELLTASHIVGWAEDASQRVNVANGLCLNRLHDAAFDQHLITFDSAFRLVIGLRVRRAVGEGTLSSAFLTYEGGPLAPALRRPISEELLAQHREGFRRAEALAA